MKGAAMIITAMLIASVATAEEGILQADDAPPSRTSRYYTGLSVLADASALWVDNNTANFYSGRPGNENTILRVLHSNYFGQQIWQNLFSQGLISSAVGSYQQLSIEEYPNMYYTTSYQIGIGVRYDYEGAIGWLLRFDIGKVGAVGAFLLSSTNGTGILSDNRRYIRCGIAGEEERINIDLGVAKTWPLSRLLDLEVDAGVNVNNTKVKNNMMEIGGQSYSILDLWGGQTPDYGVGAYDYVNQGGIGWGVFGSVMVGYQMKSVGALKIGYTCYHTLTTLSGYSQWGWHHLFGVRIEMNNFSFI